MFKLKKPMYKILMLIVLALNSVFLISCGAGGGDYPVNPVAQGPGTGGTGPFTSTSEEVLALNYTFKPDGQNNAAIYNIYNPKYDLTASNNGGSFTANNTNDYATAAPQKADASVKSTKGDKEEAVAEGKAAKVDAEAVSSSGEVEKVAADKSKSDEPKNVESPKSPQVVAENNSDVTKMKNKFMIYIINKSTDDQVCGDFRRNIKLKLKQKEVLNTQQPDLNNLEIVASVSNLSKSSPAYEIRSHCKNFRLLDSYNNVISDSSQQCTVEKEQLKYLPAQTHEHKLSINDIGIGTYTIEYLNTAKDVPYEQCKTFVQFQILNIK